MSPGSVSGLQMAPGNVYLGRCQENLLQTMRNIHANAEELKGAAQYEMVHNLAKRMDQIRLFSDSFPGVMADHQVQHVFVHLETQTILLFDDMKSLWAIYFQKLKGLTEDHISRISSIVNKDMLKFQQLLLESRLTNARATREVDTASRFNLYHTAVYDCHSSLL